MTALITALTDAGVRDVSLDPAEVTIPGVWVKAPIVRADTLAGYVLVVQLVLIVAPATPDRALVALGELLDIVANTLGGPHGEVTPGSVVMPDRSICPCYTYPITLNTDLIANP